jgi:hypothetical protein
MNKDFDNYLNRYGQEIIEKDKFSETCYQGHHQFALSLEISQWIDEEYSLKKLRGSVVLLDFWG